MSKRKCQFNENLQTKYSPGFKKINDDQHAVFCTTCSVAVSIANKGGHDIEQHIKSEKHKRRIRDGHSSKTVADFFMKPCSNIQSKVSAAEATLAFHTVKHHHSFNSVDCSHKLQQVVFPDSEIGKSYLRPYENGSHSCERACSNVVGQFSRRYRTNATHLSSNGLEQPRQFKNVSDRGSVF